MTATKHDGSKPELAKFGLYPWAALVLEPDLHMCAFQIARWWEHEPRGDLLIEAWRSMAMSTPFQALPIHEAVSRVAEVGAKKYGLNNWREGRGLAYSRIVDGVMRHMLADSADPGCINRDDGECPHIWHAAAGLFFLVSYVVTGCGVDDRAFFWARRRRPVSVVSDPPPSPQSTEPQVDTANYRRVRKQPESWIDEELASASREVAAWPEWMQVGRTDTSPQV